MGARVNFIFKQSDGNAVGLYSHWGEDSWAIDLALALKHAARRKGDESYYVRMAISYMLQYNILDETGYGITAFQYTDSHMAVLDHPILIDLAKEFGKDTILVRRYKGIDYELKLDTKGFLHFNGEVFDSSVGKAPLSFVVGSGQIIPGFENALIGKNIGDKVNVDIPAVEAYGEYRNDLVVKVPNEQLPGPVEVGMSLQAQAENGMPINVSTNIGAVDTNYRQMGIITPLNGVSKDNIL